HWVPGLNDDGATSRGDLTVTTPWHFEVLAEDGLGRLVEAEHRRQAALHGIEDGDSWPTYETMFRIHFHESVLLNRYSQRQCAKGFMLKMESVMSDILELNRDRVKKLRTRLHALQSGRLRALRASAKRLKQAVAGFTVRVMGAQSP